jgi:osmoprotectant transport system ATP-binding protein
MDWSSMSGAPPSEALAIMAAKAVDWIGVRDGDRLLGWAWGDDLGGLTRVGDARLQSFRAHVTPTTSLREALDGIVNSRTRVAVVLDDRERYQGMITIDALSEGIQ